MSTPSKIPLLTTGSSGLVGSRFALDYQDEYKIQNLDLNHPTQPTDITQLDQVLKTVAQSPAKTLIHLAAFTDVTRAWKEKDDKSGLAYQVNVEGTRNIIQACEQFDKHLIHISTAYVFDGEQEGLYLETDQPNPIEWYGQTKWEAEQLVMESEADWTILRIDQPFRSDHFLKPDVARRIISNLQNNRLPPQFTNQYFGPTFIDDLAKVLDFFIEHKVKGLFHASSGEKWSPFEFAQAIQKTHQLPGEVKPGDLTNYLKTLNRPYQQNTALECSKLRQVLDFSLISIKEAIGQIKP